MDSKDTFIAQHNARKHTLDFINALGTKPPQSVEYAAYSQISRGFYVQLYASLEIFARERFEELTSQLRHTAISFDDLPVNFQTRAIDTALQALQSRIKILANDFTAADLRRELQSESGKISSTAEANYKISKYSFGYNGSNIRPTEYYNLLNCLNIPNDAPAHIKDVATNLGKDIFDIRNDILNIYNRRHVGAHTVGGTWGLADLRRDSDIIYHFGISLDILLTTAIKTLLNPSQRGNQIVGNQIKFLKIHEQPNGKWNAYRHDNPNRRIGQADSYEDIFGTKRAQAIEKGELISIIYDKNNNIIDWLEN